MNSATLLPTFNENSQAQNTLNWQAQATNLYRNYILVELLLCQPKNLSAEALANYQNLQKMLVRTMEQFMTEFDELDEQPDFRYTNSHSLLMEHTDTMEELNRLVGDMVRDAQYCIN